jgi:hypothetical protein
MSRVDPSKFHYFSAAENRVVPRYGSFGFIGAKYVEKVGFVVDTDVVVKITDAAYRKNLKAFQRAIRDKSLFVRTAEDHRKYVEKTEKASADAAKAGQTDTDTDTTSSSNSKKRSSGKKGE